MEESFRQDTSDQEDDDVLSLSDLPIYGGDETPENKDFVVKEYTSSLSFEFFSEEWSSTILSTDSTDHKDTPTVVFSGQIIPHDETPAALDENTLVIENKGRKFGYRRLSVWNFSSLTGPARSGRYVYKSGYKDDVPVVTAPRAKWYLYIFGLARFPPKMHVRDLRRRQGSSTSKRSIGGGTAGGDESDRSKSAGGGGGGGKGVGWWTLIRVLGCGGGGGCGGDEHSNTVVKGI